MSRYASVDELKTLVKKGDGDDTALGIILDGAEDAIDRFCRRPYGFVATSGVNLYRGSGTAVQPIDECVSISKVEVKDAPSDTAYVEWAVTDYTYGSGDPRWPEFNRTPYTMLIIAAGGDYSVFTSGRYTWRSGFPPDADSPTDRGVPTVRVTATWGYAATVPNQIKVASIMQAIRWYNRLRGGMSDALASGELGQILYTRELDPDVAMILERGRFIRQTVG